MSTIHVNESTGSDDTGNGTPDTPYQSPAFDAGDAPDNGAAADVPNRMRWNPNASTTGPTASCARQSQCERAGRRREGTYGTS